MPSQVGQTTRSYGWAAKAVHGHSLWIEPCERREGCKHSTEAAVRGEIPGMHGPQANSPPPPRQTSLQHEVVSSTVIRPCSREHLPGTLQYSLIRGVEHWPGSPWVDAHTPSLPASPAAVWGVGSQRRPAKRSKTLSPELSRARCLSSLFLSSSSLRVGFEWWRPFSLLSFFPLPSLKPTAYTRISCLVLVRVLVSRASVIPLRPALTLFVNSSSACLTQSGLPDLDIPSRRLLTLRRARDDRDTACPARNEASVAAHP